MYSVNLFSQNVFTYINKTISKASIQKKVAVIAALALCLLATCYYFFSNHCLKRNKQIGKNPSKPLPYENDNLDAEGKSTQSPEVSPKSPINLSEIKSDTSSQLFSNSYLVEGKPDFMKREGERESLNLTSEFKQFNIIHHEERIDVQPKMLPLSPSIPKPQEEEHPLKISLLDQTESESDPLNLSSQLKKDQNDSPLEDLLCVKSSINSILPHENVSLVKVEEKIEKKSMTVSFLNETKANEQLPEVLEEKDSLLDENDPLDADDSFIIETLQQPPTNEEIKIYRESSSYSLSDTFGGIFITVNRKSIKILPEFHLQKLCPMIEDGLRKMGEVKLVITFINESGVDSGGLSRDFLDDLLSGLFESKILAFKPLVGLSLALPHAINDHLQPLPQLNEDEQQLYRCLGKLMFYCYQSAFKNDSKNYLLGRRFDDGLFKAVLSLTAEEIDTPFEQLTLQTTLKMCQALVDAHMEAGMDLDYLKKRIDWLFRYDLLNDRDLSEAALSVHYSELLPQHFTINGEDEDPDLTIIKQNREEFKELLSTSLFLQKDVHGQFGPQLAPIHAIAQGMKLICNPSACPNIDDDQHWDTAIRQIPYQDFSGTVQGLLDRNEIANRIKPGYLWGNSKIEIEKKVKWLQDWIVDEKNGATEDELKRLLKFLTGSTSLPKDKTITVNEQEETFYPVPIANTCFLSMKLAPVPSNYGSYNDYTEKNFIKCLKKFIINGSVTFLIK